MSAMPTTMQGGVSNHVVVQRTTNGLPDGPTNKSAKSYDMGHQTNRSMAIKAVAISESMKSVPTNAAEPEALSKKVGSPADAAM